MSTIEQLERNKEDNKKLIDQSNLARKLIGDSKFRKLILEEYMIHEASRLIGSSADPNLSDVQRADMVAMAQAPGHLKRWLNVIGRMGDQALRDNAEIDLQLDELRAEEDIPGADVSGDE